jgi:hypothetical protein
MGLEKSISFLFKIPFNILAKPYSNSPILNAIISPDFAF